VFSAAESRKAIYGDFFRTADSTGSTSIIKHHMLREGYIVDTSVCMSLYENKEDCCAGVVTTTISEL
jgi:hypothetical protein